MMDYRGQESGQLQRQNVFFGRISQASVHAVGRSILWCVKQIDGLYCHWWFLPLFLSICSPQRFLSARTVSWHFLCYVVNKSGHFGTLSPFSTILYPTHHNPLIFKCCCGVGDFIEDWIQHIRPRRSVNKVFSDTHTHAGTVHTCISNHEELFKLLGNVCTTMSYKLWVTALKTSAWKQLLARGRFCDFFFLFTGNKPLVPFDFNAFRTFSLKCLGKAGPLFIYSKCCFWLKSPTSIMNFYLKGKREHRCGGQRHYHSIKLHSNGVKWELE